MPLSCRFYQQKYPAVDDVVMVTVKSIAELGAYVELLEYNNIQGMILLSELSRRRIRSMNKLIRIGNTEPVVVIRVDEEKGYIDLSKRRVGKEDIQKCNEKFSKAKNVNSILRHIGELLGYKEDEEFEALYQQTAWFLEEKYKNAVSAYDIFKEAVTDNSILAECGLSEEAQKVLIEQLQMKLQPQAVKIRADIDCFCYEYEGIDAVKAALREGLALGSEEIPIKINLVSSPHFVVTTQTTEMQDGVKRVEAAIEAIRASIEKAGGVLKVKMAPKVVTAVDDADLNRMMEVAERQQKQVEADDDVSESDDGSGDEA